MTRPRPLFRVAVTTLVACLLIVPAGCFGGDDDPEAVACSESTLKLRVVAGPPADPAQADPEADGDATTSTVPPVDEDASKIAPGSTVEATGARLDDRCDEKESGEPLKGLRVAVVQGEVDLNVAGVDADEDGRFVVTFGLPENLPTGPAEVVVRGAESDAGVLVKASFEVAPTA